MYDNPDRLEVDIRFVAEVRIEGPDAENICARDVANHNLAGNPDRGDLRDIGPARIERNRMAVVGRGLCIDQDCRSAAADFDDSRFDFKRFAIDSGPFDPSEKFTGSRGLRGRCKALVP